MTYRIRFEAVKLTCLSKYMDADPYLYDNATQIVPNSQIPDEDWYEIITPLTDNPWSQYRTLKEWNAKDCEFVRNVKLERWISEPQWELINE
jgi:hypothetical protein